MVLLAALTLAACTSGAAEGEGESSSCVGDDDCDGTDICIDEKCEPCAPPGNDPCLPKCGNDIGVGKPCTKDGGECNDNPVLAAKICTVDQVPDADLVMCTGPCLDDSDCGADAVCTGDPEGSPAERGCVPAACVD